MKSLVFSSRQFDCETAQVLYRKEWECEEMTVMPYGNMTFHEEISAAAKQKNASVILFS